MKKGHNFPRSFGFGGSSGKVQHVRPYTRGTPTRKAEGGVVHSDAQMDRSLVRGMVKSDCLKK